MNADELRALQAPLKDKYRESPDAAVLTLRAEGKLGNGIASRVEVRGGTVGAEGDLDFRGTLGVSKEAPVGLQRIRLAFALDTDATEEQLDTLVRLTERYCVVLQTLRQAPQVVVSRTRRVA
jgi:hypothetical protein